MCKTILLICAACSASVSLTACFSPTQSTITEFDGNGNVVKTTVTSESVIKTVAGSTKDKSVIVWDNSWLAYMAASTATVEDPTPTVKMGIGKADKGAATVHKGHDLTLLPDIITATRAGDVTVTASGIGSTINASQTVKSDETSVTK